MSWLDMIYGSISAYCGICFIYSSNDALRTGVFVERRRGINEPILIEKAINPLGFYLRVALYPLLGCVAIGFSVYLVERHYHFIF